MEFQGPWGISQKFQSTILSRDNLSREIGRKGTALPSIATLPMPVRATPEYVISYNILYIMTTYLVIFNNFCILNISYTINTHLILRTASLAAQGGVDAMINAAKEAVSIFEAKRGICYDIMTSYIIL